ncbi:MAG: bifunctional 2-C-methyl-D-erythritol 4-phosphate cytidylyltransferase/2-C-methyl-D-erythritol 2,4-cyclodiphosphate synthase [Alcanivorax sp.]
MGIKSKSFHIIIVAAGSGRRLSSDMPKQYLTLGGVAILRRTLDVFQKHDALGTVCVVINPDHKVYYENAVRGMDGIKLCHGGETRQQSVNNGLKELACDADDIVLIHDAARPFLRLTDIDSVLYAMERYDAASLAVPVADTLRYANEEGIANDPVSRDHLWAMQTPQAFKYKTIIKAHESYKDDATFTDDTQMVSAMGVDVKLVRAGKHNFKITTQEDLHMAERMLSTEVRTGMGFDVHAFDEADDVTSIRLCGVDIPFDRKLKGHSDADVGLHTITDAILGAIGEGDIGQHFPPSNNDFKDMDSAIFLEKAMELLRTAGGKLINVDVTMICERPKIGDHKDAIILRIAEILGVSPRRVNIKATTTEKLGFTGRKEGIAAQAVVSVEMPAIED